MGDATPGAALIEVAQALSGEEDVDALLARVAALAVGPLGYERAAVHLLSEDGTLRLAAWAGSPPEPKPSFAVTGGSAAARAATQHRIVASDGSTAIPLLLTGEGGAVVGVLQADGTPNAAEGAQGLAALADLAAVAIERDRLRSALDERSEWFERLSEIDGLTGLANRRTLVRATELELVRAQRQNTAVAVVLFDVEDFAGLVERVGRAAADEALRRIASLLTGNVRLIDTVARYGPDEFVVLAPGATGPALERRIVAAAAAQPLDGETTIRLRAGRAVYPNDGTTADELLIAAERRLRSRRAGTGAGATD